MNLYKISNNHNGAKSSFNGIVEFKLSENDDTIFNYIDRKYACWFDDELNQEDLDEIKENMKDEREGNDYYYGVDRYYWECVKYNITEAEVKVLEDCGVIKIDLTLI